jgi:hypothetical protein
VDDLRIPDEIASHPNARLVTFPLERGEHGQESERLVRALRDALRYFDEALADASWARKRAMRRLLKLAGHPAWKTAAASFSTLQLPHGTSARLDAALRTVEDLVPPPEKLVRAMRDLRPDGLLLVTRCTPGGYEADVVKAARLLDVPSILLPWSWDNLSSKAVLHAHPDHLLVWNELQADEAVELHGVPRQRIEVVGAPNFDRFFAQVEALEGTRNDDGRKTIVYAGSSKNVAPDEPDILARWLEAVREAEDPAVRNARVRVRPHPGGRQWRTWSPPDDPLVSAERWAKSERDRLAPLLVAADVVVALNTSAEIEAAIAGRSVVTFRAGPAAPGQEGSLHFQYLLEQNGGFVIDSADLDEHVCNLSRVLAGDSDHDRAREFVKRFVRPGGLNEPVSPLIASTVLELSARSDALSAGRASAARR